MKGFKFDMGDASDEAFERLRRAMGPNHIDREIRNAIQLSWMALPEREQNVDEVERQIRRIVDRALSDFREDFNEFFKGER